MKTKLKDLAIMGANNKDWYDIAQASIKVYADSIGANSDRIADILAITSPRVHVSRNIKIMRAYVEHGTLDGVLPGTKLALAHYEKTGEIRGPKTKAFAAALKADHNAVVLDIWLARALGIPQESLGSKKIHTKSTQRINRVAKQLGWSPRDTQAAIWAGMYLSYHKKPNVPKLQIRIS